LIQTSYQGIFALDDALTHATKSVKILL
jgi:hypothetical protein